MALTLFCFEANSQTLKQTLLRQDSSLEDVIVIKCKAKADLFITILAKQTDWWEDIKVVNYSNGYILWTAKFDTLPSSQSILSARQISLKGIGQPLIEVFDETHIGNGFYYLYEIKGKQVNLLTKTRAVDWSFDGALEFNHKFDYSIVYKGGKLTPIYRDVNNDGITDIILKGTIQIVESDEKTKLKEYPAQKVLVFNKVKNKFVEDLKQRKGFKKDDD
jgi:hypothetical protein